MKEIREKLDLIEQDLEIVKSSNKAGNLAFLVNEFHKVTKYFLFSEKYFHSVMEQDRNFEFLPELLLGYYRNEPYFPRRLDPYLTFAIRYNDLVIDKTKKLISLMKLVGQQPGISNPEMYKLLQLFINMSKPLITQVKEKPEVPHQNKLYNSIVKEFNGRYFFDMLEYNTDYFMDLANLLEPRVFFDHFISSIIDNLENVINARKSITRGMEAGSPWSYVKGTIALSGWGIVVLDNVYSYVIKKDYDYFHPSDEPQPPVHHLDERLRNALTSVATLSGLIWNHGCTPTNYL